MGGLLILTAALVPTLLWADLTNVYVWIAVLTTAAFGAIGFADDYLKIVRAIASRPAAALQDGLPGADRRSRSASCCWSSRNRALYNTRLMFPFFKRLIPDLGWGYLPFAVFVLVGRVERREPDRRPRRAGDQHLRDRRGGVHRAGVRRPGNRVLADYLLLVRFPQAAELTVFCGSLVGASLGFLWYNSYPAEIFMGDVGSLALGAALGTVAILIKQELLLVIVGGVFVLEALSVVIQVASFKLTGKRVFKMAPLHHHFELIGWSEPKVITRFVIVAIIFALVQSDDVEAAVTDGDGC